MGGRRMARGMGWAGLVAGLLACVAAVAQEPGASGKANEAGTLSYDVLREGTRIGRYEFEIAGDPGETVSLTSRMNVAVDALFVTVYRASHDRVERWRDGRLREAEGRSNYNGKRYNFALDCGAEKCRLTVNGETKAVGPPVVSFVPWSLDSLREFTLLTEKGKLRRVTSHFVGRERITVGGQAVTSEHYRITGDVERDLWYGPEGTLLRLRYDRSGADMEIVLRSPRSIPR